MILWDLPVWFVWLELFILGSCIGSFLNVCIYRLPLHDELWLAWKGVGHPPSTCPFCKKRILAIDNVPILGWMWLRGRCRSCRHTIPFRYPMVEFLNGALWVLLYAMLVPQQWSATIQDSAIYSSFLPLAQPGWSPPSQELWLHVRYLYYLVLMEALVVATFIDFDLQIIPDSVTAPAAVVGVLGSLTGVLWLVPVWFQDPIHISGVWWQFDPEGLPPSWMLIRAPEWIAAHPILHGLAVSLAGAFVGGGMIWFMRIIGFWVFRREAMGFGDVTLMAMIGTFLGWQPMILIPFVACTVALVAVVGRGMFRPGREIPFGPYLSIATMLVLLSWKWLFPVMQRYYELGIFLVAFAVLTGIMLTGLLWLTQGIKWLLGIPLYEADYVEEWTSADQLTFFANKDPYAGVGPMSPARWPGEFSGRGRSHEQRWKKG